MEVSRTLCVLGAEKLDSEVTSVVPSPDPKLPDPNSSLEQTPNILDTLKASQYEDPRNKIIIDQLNRPQAKTDNPSPATNDINLIPQIIDENPVTKSKVGNKVKITPKSPSDSNDSDCFKGYSPSKSQCLYYILFVSLICIILTTKPTLLSIFNCTHTPPPEKVAQAIYTRLK